MTKKESNDMSIHTGIEKKDRKEVAAGLAKLLADTYVSYLKTQNYHWNVTGPQFSSLHILFENQYNDLAASVDVIAERIRALGEFAPGSFKAFASLTSIAEDTAHPSAEGMIRNLIQDNEAISQYARELTATADLADDEVTCDLLTTRMSAHEKNAWMLRSLLQ